MRHWLFYLIVRLPSGTRRKQYEAYLSRINHYLNTLCQTKKYGS